MAHNAEQETKSIKRKLGKNMDQCTEPARYKFTWPGKPESLICEAHKPKLDAVAEAMGFYLQIIPLSDEDLRLRPPCHQKV